MKLNAIQNHSHLAHFLRENVGLPCSAPSAELSAESVAINLVTYLPFTEL